MVLEECQVALVVTFCKLPSLKVPVARKCSVPFLAREPVVGVIAIDCSVAEVPVNVAVLLVRVPSVAVICVVPDPWHTARPVCVPIVATAVFVLDHVTFEEMFWVLPSLNVPMAVNCCVPPAASVAVAGVTAIETSVAVDTVSVAAGLTTPVLVEVELGPSEIGEPVACANWLTAPAP